MMKCKKILALLLSGALLLGAAACGTADSPGGALPTPEGTALSGPTQTEQAETNALTCGSILDYLGLDFEEQTIRIPETCRVAVLRGSWYDMGRQYAAQASAPVRYLIGSQLGNAISSWGGLKAVYEAMPQYEAMLKEAFPTYLDFVRGVADGLNDQGYSIAYTDVLIGFTSLGPAEHACMAVSAWGSATADGKPYAAMHSDSSHQAVYTQPAILAYPEDGNAFLSFVGFTNAYLNEKGLVSMITMGYGFAEGDMAAGLPICIGALYNAAYADDAETAAQNHIDKLRVGSGEIAHYTDGSGKAVIVETTAGHYAVRRAGDNGEKDYLLQSNGWLTEEMQSSSPELPDNTYRYNSAKKYLEDRLGKLTIDDLRSALSNTSYYDAADDSWHYTWTQDPDESCFSPENKDPKYGCALRRVFDISGLTGYVLMGSEDPLISKVPGSLGTYCKMVLAGNPGAVAAAALDEARSQVWYAARDIEAAVAAGEDVTWRVTCLDTAREAVYAALNYQTVAAAADGGEQLSLYASAISEANRAQCYAKAAQSGDVGQLADE